MHIRMRDVVLFGTLVGISAIFFDAAIAHGLWWENDPYWTYWITKTFLIVAVYILATAGLGIGIWQGALASLIHTIILEVYYDFLAPIGLPQAYWWLEFKDLWGSGFITHYLVIFAGYLLALWIYLRMRTRADIVQKSQVDRYSILSVLMLAIIILLLDGLITQGFIINSFPGITFYVQRLIITFVFLSLWGAYIGFDNAGRVMAALMLSLLWTAYSMYLGPLGLPYKPAYFMEYTELWLKSFPGGLVSALIGLWLGRGLLVRYTETTKIPSAILLLLVVTQLAIPYVAKAAELPASAVSLGSGTAMAGPEPYDTTSTLPMSGSIQISTTDVGNRWSPIQDTDKIDVTADFTIQGSAYHVTITQPMTNNPTFHYPTWQGVAYNTELHGNTGVGTNKLPKVKPEISLWGWATIIKDGTEIARLAPSHIMVMTQEPMKGITLEIGAEGKTLAAVPNGYINIMWPKVDDIKMPKSQENAREWTGWGVLLLLNIGLYLLIRRELPRFAKQ